MTSNTKDVEWIFDGRFGNPLYIVANNEHVGGVEFFCIDNYMVRNIFIDDESKNFYDGYRKDITVRIWFEPVDSDGNNDVYRGSMNFWKIREYRPSLRIGNYGPANSRRFYNDFYAMNANTHFNVHLQYHDEWRKLFTLPAPSESLIKNFYMEGCDQFL